MILPGTQFLVAPELKSSDMPRTFFTIQHVMCFTQMRDSTVTGLFFGTWHYIEPKCTKLNPSVRCALYVLTYSHTKCDDHTMITQ